MNLEIGIRQSAAKILNLLKITKFLINMEKVQRLDGSGFVRIIILMSLRYSPSLGDKTSCLEVNINNLIINSKHK